MMELLFWSCVGFAAYSYFGYPAAVALIARLRPLPVRREPTTPFVSFIITVHNEQARIESKILNTLAIEYPRDRVEIIVASDCSTDDTHAIVGRYSAQGVRLVVAPRRGGKEFAQGLSIAKSSGEILVFSDVATRLQPDGLRAILLPFADHDVGCVSSVDRVVDRDGRVTGESAYVRYEMFLRAVESQAGTVVGLSGSFFAARREVCEPWSVDLPSDFITLLNTLRRGMRGVSEPTALGFYQNVSDERREYGRKVRTVVRGIAGLIRHLDVLNPVRYGLAAWQLFSHKLCRWLVPFAVIGALVANLALAFWSTPYLILAVAQVATYGIAAMGIARRWKLHGLPRLVSFMVLVNISILNAWYDVLRGRRVVAWDPSKR
jgi:glycosyltransferase involved in cell wall biosynthesis